MTHDTTTRSPILEERESTHGAFGDVAATAFSLKYVIRAGRNYESLTPAMRESLDMIATKISRILHGDPKEKDHWDDIAGYAELGGEDARGGDGPVMSSDPLFP